MTSGQEDAALKKVYGKFYHQLVDVLSDGDTHRSIVSDLHKRSVISEKVQAEQMTSTQEWGRSLLTVLDLDEKPNKLEEMTAQLSKSEQGIYVEDQYTTQTILKPSGRFYKQLAGFKTGWPDLIHYVHPGPL